MSEQDQTETKSGGSVVLPAGVAVAAGFGARNVLNKGANSLAAAALNPEALAKDAKPASKELIEGAAKVKDAGALKKQLIGTKIFQNDEIAKNVKEITIEAVKDGDKVTHTITAVQADGNAAVLKGIDKLTGKAADFMKDKTGAHTLTADELKTLTEKSWLQKTGKAAETTVLKTVSSAKEFKEAGAGVKATFSHLGGGSKAIAATAVVATVGGAVIAGKNLFGGSHTSRVEADRAAMPDQAAAR